jgi:remodeling and spacing factor 1
LYSDSSSQSDGLEPEEEEEEDEPHELKSDHEFSPESDLELGPGEELQPAPRRARTARRGGTNFLFLFTNIPIIYIFYLVDKAAASRKEKGTKETADEEPETEEVDEYRCQKCNAGDRPEWILLCDNCDNGKLYSVSVISSFKSHFSVARHLKICRLSTMYVLIYICRVAHILLEARVAFSA